MVELPSSMQVLHTFILGAAFKVLGFLSLVVPDKCWEKAIHWETGMLSAFGNFYIQVSAYASDFGLSPLNTTITPCASFWMPGQTRSFFMLPKWNTKYLIHPRTKWRSIGCPLKINVILFSRSWLACKGLLIRWTFGRGNWQLQSYRLLQDRSPKF